jgi:hypothetical protein
MDMDNRHGDTVMTCTMDTDMFMLFGTRTWVCIKDMDIQHGHGQAEWTWTCSMGMDMKHGHRNAAGPANAAWT